MRACSPGRRAPSSSTGAALAVRRRTGVTPAVGLTSLSVSVHFALAPSLLSRYGRAIVVVAGGAMRKKLAGLLSVIALAGLPATAPAERAERSSDGATAVVARACSSGYRHAVMDRQHKCLRRGQFCKRRADRQYHRYGYHCHRYDPDSGRYHLS